ncbi:hypothetical protein BG004_007911 [Podila humilis]|nr:hypothetical protein BG004_007911 [Podila humilis]
MSSKEARTGPTLPNECLIQVIQCFASDIRTLHQLLFINRFFFDTALPLLMHDVFITWQLNYHYREPRASKRRLMALLIASVLHHNKELTAHTDRPEDYLTPFGIKLMWPTTTTSTSASMDLIMTCLRPGVKMTTDYSKHFRVLFSYMWEEAQLGQFIQLYNLEDNNSNNNGERDYDYDCNKAKVNRLVHYGLKPCPASKVTLESAMPPLLVDRIANLLLHYNYEDITAIHIHINEIVEYLPLADKFRRLECIDLTREDEDLPPSHLAGILDFITIHNSTFPQRKRSLEIDFSSTWTFHDVLDSMNSVIQIQSEMVDILMALKKVYSLDRSHFLDFYRVWDKFDYEHVEAFSDYDNNSMLVYGKDLDGSNGDIQRLSKSEICQRQAELLKKCTNLRFLSLHVRDQNVFTWALAPDILTTATATSSSSSSSTTTTKFLNSNQNQNQSNNQKYLPNLRELELHCHCSPVQAVKILGDAVAAFGGCTSLLQRIELYSDTPGKCEEFGKDNNNNKNDNNSKNNINEVVDNVLRMAMSEWQIPWLTEMCIVVPDLHGLYVGSFDKCPMLKKIQFRFGLGKAIQHNGGGGGGRGGGEAIMLDLFPKWNLPRLVELDLGGTAGLLFDYESLGTMSSLRTFECYTHELSEYSERIQYIPRLSAHLTTPLHNNSSSSEIHEVDDYSLLPGTQEQGRYLGGYHLPNLETLTLSGPNSIVFCFDWLKTCPKLQQITLFNETLDQRLPLSWSSPSALVQLPDAIPGQSETFQSSFEVHYEPQGPFSGALDDLPLWDSSLQELKIQGPWAMSEQDFVRVLTHYTPNLERLYLDTIHPGPRGCLMETEFVQLLFQADMVRDELALAYQEVKQKGEEEEEEEDDDGPRKVTKLVDIRTRYSSMFFKPLDMGLVGIFDPRPLDLYITAGIRVYTMHSRYYIDEINLGTTY